MMKTFRKCIVHKMQLWCAGEADIEIYNFDDGNNVQAAHLTPGKCVATQLQVGTARYIIAMNARTKCAAIIDGNSRTTVGTSESGIFENVSYSVKEFLNLTGICTGSFC